MSTHYEVTLSDRTGRIVHTEHFGPGQRAQAIDYRRKHQHSTGWTVTPGRNGEDREVGLHARTTYEQEG